MTGHRRTGGLRSTHRLTVARHRPAEPDVIAEPKRDPYVRVRISVLLYDAKRELVGRVEQLVSVERASWDQMSPAARRSMIDEFEANAEVEHVETAWDVENPGDAADVAMSIEPDQGE